ncbi:CDF family Co(II)/Ni(II) efflux transporter DmeF [Steroidobacter cummioxidans]|uniref:CDF family Co(II)/Ni(II) efflux transporter DmeF n=1 Tax=Steroidobacter cummioxidans TaxID=1803913 RepID=UPI000E30F076|nr:CDF family Co(II)/Ni(II) efflux transporter DmeF [Steroidobacter cummioxidans]
MSSIADFVHTHTFDEHDVRAERRTRLVVWLTATMMIVEIFGGWLLNSMALLADGWHMSSHALALGVSLLAYSVARRFSADRRFNFGTWKVEVLGGYTSAVLLLGVAALMLFQSVERMAAPRPIQYDEAIGIAIVGLIVNAVCAGLLQVEGHHHRHNEHGHAHHHDLNLRSAYLHVLADAATSVLAIVALTGGKFWGADWLDPTMGIVGAVLVAVWAIGLLRDAGRVLLDAELDVPVAHEIREAIEQGPIAAEISDLHVWRVGKGQYACIVSVLTSVRAEPEDFKQQLRVHEELVHMSIEVNYVGSRPNGYRGASCT